MMSISSELMFKPTTNTAKVLMKKLQLLQKNDFKGEEQGKTISSKMMAGEDACIDAIVFVFFPFCSLIKYAI